MASNTPTQFPFLDDSDFLVGSWLAWNLADGPLPFNFPNQQPIGSIWVPNVPAAITVSLVDPVAETTTPIYVSDPAGSELIPLPQDSSFVSLSTSADTGTYYVFFATANYDPFRIGPIAAIVTTVNATLPITSTGGQSPTIGLAIPLAVVYGGSGSTNPSLQAGAGINITGAWPNQKIIATAAGTVISVGATPPLASSGGNTPVISLEVPLPQEYGGTGTTTPGDTNGPGIEIEGEWPNETIINTGVLSLNGESGIMSLVGIGGINIDEPSGTEIEIDGTALVETITSDDGSITVDRTGQSVDLAVVASALQALAVNVTSGSSSGSLAFGSALPGGSGQNYILVAFGTTSFHDESQTLTITGSGGTWASSPATFGNGDGGSTAWNLFGSAVGGQTPAIAWTQSDSLGAQPFRGIILAFPAA